MCLFLSETEQFGMQLSLGYVKAQVITSFYNFRDPVVAGPKGEMRPHRGGVYVDDECGPLYGVQIIPTAHLWHLVALDQGQSSLSRSSNVSAMESASVLFEG